MPELYTFVTERTDDYSQIEQLSQNLHKEEFDHTIHALKSDWSKHIFYYISGNGWCTDCGAPIELISCFDGLEINAAYCNHNEYGIIDKNHVYTSVTDSSPKYLRK